MIEFILKIARWVAAHPEIWDAIKELIELLREKEPEAPRQPLDVSSEDPQLIALAHRIVDLLSDS